MTLKKLISQGDIYIQTCTLLITLKIHGAYNDGGERKNKQMHNSVVDRTNKIPQHQCPCLKCSFLIFFQTD